MLKINIKPDCSLCRWEYITHDKGKCVGCVNHSHFELCTERDEYRKLIKEKEREA